MSYSAAVEIKEYLHDGKKTVLIYVSESGASNTSEWSTVPSASNTVSLNGDSISAPYLLPKTGKLVQFQAVLTGGSGTTITPRLTKATGAAANSIDSLADRDSAAASHNSSLPVAYGYKPQQAEKLYGKAVVDSGSNNTIEWILTITQQMGDN